MNAQSVALRDLRAKGEEPLDLTLSNPTEVGLPYPDEEIRAALADPANLHYRPHPLGLPRARIAVGNALALPSSPDIDRILLTASTSEAYAFLFKLLCDPGDRVLVPQPSYPLFAMLGRFEAIEVASYDLLYDGEWHIDFSSVDRALTDRTRAIVTVNPNNPTGSYLKVAELHQLQHLGVSIISDEVFAPYAWHWDERTVTAITSRPGPALQFALGGLSKFSGLPQLKLAWTVASGPDDLVREAMARLEHISDAFLSLSTPAQSGATAFLDAGAVVQESIRTRVRENLRLLRERFAPPSSVTPLLVEGGWYAVLRLPATHSDEEWALRALERAHVLLHPGYFYDFSEDSHVVLSLLVPNPQFDRGLCRLAELVEAGV